MTESRTWRASTAWTRRRTAPMRAFLSTESGSAGVLVAAVVAALVWVNVDAGSYARVWHTEFSIRLGGAGITHDLQTWIDSGLMTFFFLVVGLEARREFDLGDLRDRRSFLLPLVAGLLGMAVPVGIFLAINAGNPSAHGWGVAMSTDTALALGLLSLLGRNVPDRVRIFVLTVFVVDDLAALVVIAFVYSDHVRLIPLIVAAVVFAAMLVTGRRLAVPSPVLFLLGVVVWGAMLRSGVDPVVAGLVLGLSATAYTPARGDLEEATGAVRRFREQPTPELARSATTTLTATLSRNERLQYFYHPWTSYVIVPLFALANAGIVINGSFLAHAYTTPITLGIVVGYLVGKPLAVVGTSWVLARVSRDRFRPPVGWGSVLGSGTIAGIGFTVALLIATRAFHGTELAEAKLGALTSAGGAALITFVVFRVIDLFAPARRARLLLGRPELLQDLDPPIDPERDHVRGPADAPVTIVEYGDFECPYCGQAEPVVRELLTHVDIRYVWRHLPLLDVHPQAQLAAEAAEAAAEQGAFWPMHDLLLDHQDELKPVDLVRHAEGLGLDPDRFHASLKKHAYAARIAQDVESADRSGVSGTPSFFVNGQRHYGAYDIDSLTAAIKAAKVRAGIVGAR